MVRWVFEEMGRNGHDSLAGKQPGCSEQPGCWANQTLVIHGNWKVVALY